ncbi:DMT family transporter [Patescibacteria group bacterium]
MNKGYLLIFLTAIISGVAIFINKFGVSVINPYVFAWLKNITVALLLTGGIILFKDWKMLKLLTKKQWFLLLGIGLIGGAVPFLLFFKGLSLTLPAQGAFLHKTMFVFVAIFALVFLKEKIDKRFLVGGLLLILGSLFLLKKLSFTPNQGDLLILLATMLWAAENTLSKYVLRELQGRTVAWARMFFGAFFILLFLLITGQASLVGQISLLQIGWVAVTSVFLFGYVTCWYSGLKLVPLHKAAAILLLGSPITTMLSFVFGRVVSIQEVLSGLFIIFGVLLIMGFGYILKLTKIRYVRA